MTALTWPAKPGTFWRRWTPLFAGGAVGVAALIAADAGRVVAQLKQVPVLAALPAVAQLAVAAIQPLVLVAVTAATGVALAPRLGLRSRVAEKAAGGAALWSGLRSELPLAVGLGALDALATVALDIGTRVLLPPVRPGAEQLLQVLGHRNVPSVLAALLYGGITEEILLRWGVMTLLTWAGWRLLQRDGGRARPAVMWTAIGLSALLFGAGHLPAAAMMWPLTPFVIARTLVLNAVFGLVAGWLYWRRSLEAAMAAHMAAHIVITLANLAAAATS